MVKLERTYTKSRGVLLNAVNDILEMQKGKVIISDSEKGQLGFEVELYGIKQIYQFSVSQSLPDLCTVSISNDSNGEQGTERVGRMFHLLDSMVK